MTPKPILIVGLFNSEQKKHNYISAAEQLSALLSSNQVPVIKTSFYKNKLARLVDTVFSILVQGSKFDIAIVPLYGTRPSFIWQEAATRLLKLLKKKIILIVHGGSIPQRMEINADPFLRSLNRASVAVCPSGYLQEYLKVHGVETVLIENVLNLSAYTFCEKKSVAPRIMWMRAFEDTYNPEMAIRVAALLKKTYPNFTMVMAGKDEGLLGKIKSMAAEYQLVDNIIFPGFITLQQKIEYAQTQDIYICTNRVDNAPVSLIEFMALGLPIVSVNTGGIPYIIKDGYNGLLVEPDDAAAMAEKIDMLIKNPLMATALSRNAYDYSRLYGNENVLQKWLSVFDRLNFKSA
ncbi:MAG: glycosyltransferase family 4 protein [Panacibacter sp.]